MTPGMMVPGDPMSGMEAMPPVPPKKKPAKKKKSAKRGRGRKAAIKKMVKKAGRKKAAPMPMDEGAGLPAFLQKKSY